LLKDKSQYELFRTDAIANDGTGVRALDITDESAVYAYVEGVKPEIIINCAAMTAVDLCESEQDKAYRINALGPKYLAKAAEITGAKLVHVSTDYVFDGQATTPYTEDAVPNPTSVYGKTKQAGDEFVQEECKKFFILRTAWVYGEGKNFAKTMLRLAESGNKVRVVSDQYGTPTSALELARVITFLMETEEYGIYHATCEGSTTWYEFALYIFKEAGKNVEVEPIPSSEYQTAAKRPMYSVLENKALYDRHGYVMKEWKDAFREYMRETI
jgi:dTDP-4-dehydrorhamnose reductase